ncbi:MAG TPA: hypothetical protein VFD30_01670 [Terriglobia bacterium]|nr:hypothetical protein [Terriglobia bacterium]
MEKIRAGAAPLSVRRQAVEGSLPVSLEEKIEILVHLTGDPDEAVRQGAMAALERWDTRELAGVLSNPLTPASVLEYCATRFAGRREDICEALVANPALPDRLSEQILVEMAGAPSGGEAEPLSGPAFEQTPAAGSVAHPPEPRRGDPAEPMRETERETLLQKISRMSTVQKIKLALTGNQESRLVLIRDANKVVARAVLQSPKLSEGEIEAFASMKNVSEEVLRVIAMNRGFMKNYGVLRSLVTNPRAPIDVTLPLLNRLNERDLKGLMLNRNVPDVIRGMATKMVKQKEEANKPKILGRRH